MKLLTLLCAGVGLLFLGGCGILPNDPTVIDRSERWFRRTDPAAFFAHEEQHGRVYFIGFYDPEEGVDSPAPGVRRDDPAFTVARTWFVLPDNGSPGRHQRFLASARAFARRYNPLVLDYLKGHPTAK